MFADSGAHYELSHLDLHCLQIWLILDWHFKCLSSESACSKLTLSVVNVLFKFKKFMSQICQYFLSKKQKRVSFFQLKISAYLIKKSLS